jgi:release factor glutamine methyltransferase
MVRAAAASELAPSERRELTIAGARRLLTDKFRSAGLDTPELDARILVGHALALDHAALAATATLVPTAAQREAIDALARRRLAREPVARIVGSKEFWSLKLAVNAATLVPRPETETVVEAALAALDESRTRRLRIADLGTGTGALLIALLAECPHASGIGTDTSVGALMVARDNARRHGIERAAFVACDMTEALRGPFDLIVSNPPYIPTGDLAALPPEVRDFEPRAALDGGPDGLDYYRRIAASAPALLERGGTLVVELGAGQAAPVAALLSAAGLEPLPPLGDLGGTPRALFAKNP